MKVRITAALVFALTLAFALSGVALAGGKVFGVTH